MRREILAGFLLAGFLQPQPSWAATNPQTPVTCILRQAAFDGETAIVIPVVSGLIDDMPARVGNVNGPDIAFDKPSLKKRYVDNQSCFFVDWARPCIPFGFNDLIPAPHSQVKLLAMQGKGAPQSYSVPVDGEPVSAHGNPLMTNSKLVPGLFANMGFIYCGSHLDLNEPFNVRLVSGHDEITLSWPKGATETSSCASRGGTSAISNSALPICGGAPTATAAEILWQRGQALFVKKDFAAAQKYFTKLAFFSMDERYQPEASFYYAECHFRLNQMKEAA